MSDRLSVVLLNWRDRTHPQGGGSEIYVETVAAGLSRRGHRATIVCARHEGSAADEVTADGVRLVRVGGELSVYPRAALAYLAGRLGRTDVVVDVQNGVPFAARSWFRGPVVLLCHHVHREQWPVVRGPVGARIGWFVESRVSPALYRGTRYVTVSDASRDELASLGVDPAAIRVIHNGTPVPHEPLAPKSPTPLLCVLGRLVPHKRVELAIDTAAALRSQFPGLRLVVAGRGWWHDELVAHARRRGLGPDVVEFAGFVDEDRKERLLAQAWVSLMPSLKEGWGLTVVEAAAHGTPSVAFASAGGVAQSVVDGRTGVLVDTAEQLTAATAALLADGERRARLGAQARAHALRYGWPATVDAWEALLAEVTGRRRTRQVALPRPRAEAPRELARPR